MNMAAMMSTLCFTLAFLTLSGLSTAQQLLSKDCTNMDELKVVSKMVTCITTVHPEYLLTVLTKIDNPAAMESPDFMCSNQDMMAAMVKCFLEYVEGCMPPAVAGQVASLMPSQRTVSRGIDFLCAHRKDFENVCVTSKMATLIQCFSQKMEAFSHISSSYGSDIHGKLCAALQVEEQCLATNLSECPATVRSNLMTALMAFFPGENCHIINPGSDTVLTFQSEGAI